MAFLMNNKTLQSYQMHNDVINYFSRNTRCFHHRLRGYCWTCLAHQFQLRGVLLASRCGKATKKSCIRHALRLRCYVQSVSWLKTDQITLAARLDWNRLTVASAAKNSRALWPRGAILRAPKSQCSSMYGLHSVARLSRKSVQDRHTHTHTPRYFGTAWKP